MKPLLSALNDIPEYRSLLAAIDNGACPAAFSGLSAVHRAHFAAGIRQELNRPVVVVCADEGEAERMARDLAALSGEEVRTLSAREFTFHNAAVVSRQYEHRRLSTLRALAAGECPLLVCTVESILQRTIPKTLLTQAAQVVRMGERHDLGELAGTLAAAGYTRCEQVEGVGQFALRGASWTFSPRPTPSPSGWSSSGTRSTPWASSIPTPSGASRISARRRSCRRRRCCPSLPLAGTAGCWRGWTVSFPRQSAARGARHWCRRWRRTGSGWRPARPSRPWTATSP